MTTGFKIEILSGQDWAGHLRFMSNSPQRSAFAEAAWIDLLARYLGGSLYVLGFFRAGGELAAAVPVWERRLPLVGAVADIPPLTPYWGPLLAPREGLRPERARAHDHEVLGAVARALADRWPYIRLALHPSLIDVRPFTWVGFRAEVRYTSTLEPRPEADFLASLPGALRNKIKQGEGAEVVTSADVAPFVAMYRMTFGRRRMRPPVAADFLSALTKMFLEKDRGELCFIVAADGKEVAGRFVMWDDRRAYDLLAASGGPAGPLGAALMWNVIRRCWARGLPLDLCGVNVPSIAQFKESFAGDLIPYYILYRYRNDLDRVAVAFARRFAT